MMTNPANRGTGCGANCGSNCGILLWHRFSTGESPIGDPMQDQPGAYGIYIGLGANLGDREATIRAALRDLQQRGDIRVSACSSLHETEPVGGPPGQPPYLNAVARLETDLSPRELLDRMHQIEQCHGRRRTVPNAPRTLDLDLLLYRDQVINDLDLIVPHPRMWEREFVMRPLREICDALVLSNLRETFLSGTHRKEFVFLHDDSAPESLSDDCLVRLISELEPTSEAFLYVVSEASSRSLQSACDAIQPLFRHGAIYVYGLVELFTSFWGKPLDGDDWEWLVRGYDRRVLAGLFRQTQRLSATADSELMRTIESEDDGSVIDDLLFVLASSGPLNSRETEAFLLRWVCDRRLAPVTRRCIFNRLASMPRTKSIDDFFTQFLIDDDKAYPELTSIASKALEC